MGHNKCMQSFNRKTCKIPPEKYWCAG